MRGSDAPYFHNDSATTLMDAVYDTPSRQDKDDLVAFVKTV
jgi:hypothetical protein